MEEKLLAGSDDQLITKDEVRQEEIEFLPTQDVVRVDSLEKNRSSWRTGVRTRISEDKRSSQYEKIEVGDSSTKQLRRSTRQRKPNLRYANAALTKDNGVVELSTYQETTQSTEWKKAMEKETQILRQNETWDLIPKLRDVKPISCKWVYKVKIHPDGSVERYKARLVACEFSQKYGLDYDETFSLVAKLIIVRVLSALGTSKS
ncbi:hypothetical protein ACH5RR_031698 [Cinchona calisaya]|uniref:Reverse transcriptase Ty1/copia-type domain-containing protein n=1 Tax=Cinchona calisaya TaxID=153742 RepID=A0ABD2YG04_9GENT